MACIILTKGRNSGPLNFVMSKISKIKNISFYTLGCKLNQAESAALANAFGVRGYNIVPFMSPADLTVINTCTVTNDADSKSRQAIRKAIKASPNGRTVVIGCYAQIKPHDLANIAGVDMILGTREKFNLPDYIRELEQDCPEKPLVYVNSFGEEEEYSEAPFISTTSRTRAYLKIQEGCDYYCSYCIIPFARGKPQSRRRIDCLKEAHHLVAKGYRELVLTGINIGTWQEGALDLADLLEQLSDIPGLERIRISSIEPNTISDRLLGLVVERPNICPHLHIPLQSGSPTVLERMRRKYSSADYQQLADRIAAITPGIAWGTDLITGFPGETEQEFEETTAIIEQLPLTYLHVFRYSDRTGTVASKLSDQVDFHVSKDRAAVLRELGRKKKHAFQQQFIGSVQPVLFESADSDGGSAGNTPHYVRVRVPAGAGLENTIRPVKLERVDKSVIHGSLAD